MNDNKDFKTLYAYAHKDYIRDFDTEKECIYGLLEARDFEDARNHLGIDFIIKPIEVNDYFLHYLYRELYIRKSIAYTLINDDYVNGVLAKTKSKEVTAIIKYKSKC